MAHDANENTPRIHTHLGRWCVIGAILLLFLGVITYTIEYFEAQEYVKSLCYVRTSRTGSSVCRGKRYYICYFPIWEVEYGKQNETIMERHRILRDYWDAYRRKEQFQVNN